MRQFAGATSAAASAASLRWLVIDFKATCQPCTWLPFTSLCCCRLAHETLPFQVTRRCGTMAPTCSHVIVLCCLLTHVCVCARICCCFAWLFAGGVVVGYRNTDPVWATVEPSAYAGDKLLLCLRDEQTGDVKTRRSAQLVILKQDFDLTVVTTMYQGPDYQLPALYTPAAYIQVSNQAMRWNLLG